LNVGVVGCGYWGPNLIRNLFETNRCQNVYCFDADPAPIKKLLRRYPSLKVANSLDHLVDCCDAVMVATPVSSHHDVAAIALQKGKAVFVEKPLATSSRQAEDLIELADNHKAVLMVGHTFVYSPPVRKVKQYLKKGLLGDVYFLSSSRVNLGIHRKDVDVIWDLAPHDISMFLYWLEETPTRVSAVGRACVGRLADVASIHMEFPSGALANVEISWLAPSKLRRTVIVGSKSMVVYDDTAAEKIKLYDRGVQEVAPSSFGEYQLTYRTGDIVSPNLDASEPLLSQTNHFLDCVQNGAEPESNGTMGLSVVLTLEAASESMARDGEFVALRPKRLPQSGALAMAATQGRL
jgi:predicted dehydrogenase